MSEKNKDLSHAEIDAVRSEYGLDPSRPLLTRHLREYLTLMLVILRDIKANMIEV